MNNPYLTPYEDVLDDELKDSEFRDIWEAGKTRRQIVSALISERIKRNLSQRTLAQKAGIKQPSLARVESGNVMPSLKMLSRLAKAMNAQLDIRFISHRA